MALEFDQQRLEPYTKLLATPFDHLPAGLRQCCMGVAYVHLHLPGRGDLFLTEFAWPRVTQLLPGQWYDQQQYLKVGTRLPHSTGTVYRVPPAPAPGSGPLASPYATAQSFTARHEYAGAGDLVVKFSRVGQEVPLVVATRMPDEPNATDIDNARFNGPFEEFGLVMAMRQKSYALGTPMLTHRPLAIFSPSRTFETWRLGRSRSRFEQHIRKLRHDREKYADPLTVDLDIRRDYVMIYDWVKGENAEDEFAAGTISHTQFHALAPRVTREMKILGFHVLDNKPKHYILRRRACDGQPLMRDGKLVYALVDFELLERTGPN